MTMAWAEVDGAVRELAEEWRSERPERQRRRHLDPADFDRLREAGFLHAAVPDDMGGLWSGVPTSTRPVCELLRTLAGADPSVALVAAMHPTVLAFWLAAPPTAAAGWDEQRRAVYATAADGAQWGTITSEPGSGGDILKTRSQAVPDGDGQAPLPGAAYLITGDKHFASGSGVTSFMITTAVPAGEEGPALFAIDVRGRPWDGTAGLRLTAEWDGVGMAATQSHAMRLEACPAVRLGWDGAVENLAAAAGPFAACVFTAVVLGILDEAVATARAHVAPRAESVRAYEQVEWTRAELDHWLAVQAYDGALRAVESGDAAAGLHAALRAKQAVAELGETMLRRLTRVIGGGTFARRSPFAAWFEDVRALGFLRPPWGLAYDSLFLTSLG